MQYQHGLGRIVVGIDTASVADEDTNAPDSYDIAICDVSCLAITNSFSITKAARGPLAPMVISEPLVPLAPLLLY